MKSFALGCAACALVSVGGPALAHHSFAMFDRGKDVTLGGVVTAFQWTSPHAWIQIAVPDGAGGQKEWAIECGAPGPMVRAGWSSRTLKAGDKVVLVMHPLKDGAPSGSLVKVTLPDGKVLGLGSSTSTLPVGG